jgi:hypothetical protein
MATIVMVVFGCEHWSSKDAFTAVFSARSAFGRPSIENGETTNDLIRGEAVINTQPLVRADIKRLPGAMG